MYSKKLICDILTFIDSNINSKITIEDLENKFFYNRYYIIKTFKKEIGLSITDYINSMRIYNSLLQIKSENNNLISIAFKNGFNSIEYFSETFKKIVGLNPRIVKKHYKGNSNISLNQINIINNSLINLYYIVQKKEKYLLNKKPQTLKFKNLSIFK